MESWGLANAEQVVRVERVRRVGKGESREVAHDLTSPDRTRAAALDSPGWIRGHRGIENHVRRVRDVTVGGDQSRVRKGTSARVMAALRNVAINRLRDLFDASARAATHRSRVHPEEAITLLDTPPPSNMK